MEAVLHALPQAAAIIDRHSRILVANLQASLLFGFEAGELNGQHLSVLLPGNLRQHHLQQVGTFFERPTARRMGTRDDFPAERKDGTRLDVEIGLSPFEFNRELCVLATISDATERKSSEAALRRSEERLKLALSSARLGVWEWHFGANFVYWSPECPAIIGRNHLPERYEDFLLNVHEGDRERVSGDLRRALEARSAFATEFRCFTDSGEIRWLATHGNAWFEPRGNTVRMVGTIADVTRDREAEEKLREDELRFREISESVPGAVIALQRYPDGTSRVPYASESILDVYGITKEAAEGDASVVIRLTHAADLAALRETIAQSEAHLQPWRCDFRIVRPDGRVRWISGHSRPTQQPDGSVLWYGVFTDITERNELQENLRLSQARLRAALEVGGIGTWEWDAVHDSLTIDESGARLWGHQLADLSGKPVSAMFERIHPDDVHLVADQTMEVLSGQRGAVDLDVRLLQPGAEVAWIRTAGLAERDSDGNVVRVTGANVDITQYKVLERDLRVSEERFARVFDASPLGISLVDVERDVIVEVNAAFVDIFGTDREALLEQPPSAVPGVDPAAYRRARALVEQRGSYRNFEVPFRNPRTGDERVALVTATPLSVAGRPHRLMIAADITERKRAEDDLRASQQRFNDLAHSINEVFWLTDLAKNQIVYISPAYETVWGRDPASLYASPLQWADAIHPDDRDAILAAARAKQALGSYDEQYRIIRPDGSVRWIRDRAFPVKDDSGVVVRVAGVAEDITERLELERQLRQTQKMESVGELAGGVAHDFNNWLTVISSYTDFLQGMLPPGGDAQEFLDEIRNAAERAASLTRQLLAFSRQEVLEPKVLDLNSLVLDTEKMLNRLLGEDIVVKTDLAPRLQKIRVDPGHIVQVLMNLAVNARDAMPRGGVLMVRTANVTVPAMPSALPAAGAPGDYVELSVTDTGHGMTPETLARVFEPFFTTKGVGKGTGLGLAVVHGIIEQSGGHVDVASEVNAGTTFTVRFPVVETETAIAVGPLPSSRPMAGSETVLLVEDEESVRRVVQRALTSRGYTVLTAFEGFEAVAILDTHDGPIQLLLTDVVMPGMDGREVAEAAKLRHPEIKVLYSSGYTDDAILRHGLKHSDIHFLQKPYTMDGLLRAVRSVLDGN